MGKRKGDIIIRICQNNENKRLLIEESDPEFEEIVGYMVHELEGAQLYDILLDDVNDQLYNYLEFTDEGNDLSDVISKIRDFGFISKLGQEILLDVKINRVATPDSNPRFEMVIRDQSKISKGSGRALRGLRGRQVVDKVTGLPDRQSFIKEAEFINFCVDKDRMVACFALVAIDNYQELLERYGQDVLDKLTRELVAKCKVNFREDDILGLLEENRIGVILLEANAKEAHVPLNRYRWQVSAQPLNVLVPEVEEETAVTLSIAYCQLEKGKIIDYAMDRCSKQLKEIVSEGGNKIIELEAA